MTDNTMLEVKRVTLDEYAVDIHTNLSNSDKKTILLVHGIGVSGRYFFPLAEQLMEDYQVVIVDLPGYGKTPKPARVLTIPELAAVVVQLTQVLKLDHSIILGHSMGCQIVAHAVKDQPKLYRKMILLSPTVNDDERSLFMQAVRLAQDTMYEPIKAGIIIFTDYMRMGLRRYLISCRHMLDDKIELTLKGCPIPVLYIRGQNDVIVPSIWLRQLQGVTNGRICEIADATHALQLQEPEFIAEICRDFIEN